MNNAGITKIVPNRSEIFHFWNKEEKAATLLWAVADWSGNVLRKMAPVLHFYRSVWGFKTTDFFYKTVSFFINVHKTFPFVFLAKGWHNMITARCLKEPEVHAKIKIIPELAHYYRACAN